MSKKSYHKWPRRQNKNHGHSGKGKKYETLKRRCEGEKRSVSVEWGLKRVCTRKTGGG